jgi:hypothetical protein
MCGRKKDGLIQLIPKAGFSGIVDTTKGDVVKTMKDKSIGGRVWSDMLVL